MSALRRLRGLVRGRRLVAAGFFLLLIYLFANNLDPTPRFVVQTQAKMDRAVVNMGEHEWVTLQGVSNGGEYVTVGIHYGGRHDVMTRLHLWNIHTGQNRTPPHWNTPEWCRLTTRQMFEDDNSGLVDLVGSPSGQEFLRDADAWARLRDRMPAERPNAGRNARQRDRQDDGDRGLFADTLRLSADGRHITYVVRTGWPETGLWVDSLSKATVVEDARTGQRLATLPAITTEVTVAPGGRTAARRLSSGSGAKERLRALMRVWDDPEDSEEGEKLRFVLWDLRKSTDRAQLWMPPSSFGRAEFTPDGRYVFARSLSILRWWDVETGKQVGQIIDPPNRHFLNGGRVLMVQSTDHEVLHFWDVTIGRQLPDWDLPQPREGTGTIGQLESSGGDRYIAFRFDPDSAGKSQTAIPIVERLLDKLPDLPASRDRSRILVLDVIDRRVVGKLPGRSAAFSPDGRWLATISDKGLIRVWEMPTRRPWGRGIAYAAGLVFGGWFMIALLSKVRRQLWRRKASGVSPACLDESGSPSIRSDAGRFRDGRA